MATPRAPFVCTSCARALRAPKRPSTTARAWFSSTARPSIEATRDPAPQEDPKQLPRWAQTPPAMRAPIRMRPMPQQPAWKVNDDPEVLDDVMDRFIGRASGPTVKGRDVLPEELKWLSVTHKSFDHGRRGFNDRLAFLGKRILDLQTSLALLASPSPRPAGRSPMDTHPDLQGTDNVTAMAKHGALNPARLAKLAETYGLDKAVRWKPRQTARLDTSGVDVVLAHTICAIIGAVALQKGGDVAVRLVKENVLGPLGLRQARA